MISSLKQSLASLGAVGVLATFLSGLPLNQPNPTEPNSRTELKGARVNNIEPVYKSGRLAGYSVQFYNKIGPFFFPNEVWDQTVSLGDIVDATLQSTSGIRITDYR